MGVVVENFAQKGRKFFCLRYDGGWISFSVGYLRIRSSDGTIAISCGTAVSLRLINDKHARRCTCFNELFVTAHVDDIQY